MAGTYAITNMSAINSPVDLLTVTNSNANGWLFFALNSMLFFIMFLSMLSFGLETSLLASAFVTLVLAILFSYMGLMAWNLVGIWVGVIILTFIYLMWNSRYD